MTPDPLVTRSPQQQLPPPPRPPGTGHIRAHRAPPGTWHPASGISLAPTLSASDPTPAAAGAGAAAAARAGAFLKKSLCGPAVYT